MPAPDHDPGAPPIAAAAAMSGDTGRRIAAIIAHAAGVGFAVIGLRSDRRSPGRARAGIAVDATVIAFDTSSLRSVRTFRHSNRHGGSDPPLSPATIPP